MDKLCILGESKFTQALKHKAEAAGIECVDDPEGVPVIIDTETYRLNVDMQRWQDVDCVYHSGLSSCAEAVLDTLGDVSGKHVCVVGRGHAVQGLAEALLENDATVTICHSKTQELQFVCFKADVLVVAAPVDPWPVFDNVVVVDVSGTFGGRKVSGLTTDIMLRRVMEK